MHVNAQGVCKGRLPYYSMASGASACMNRVQRPIYLGGGALPYYYMVWRGTIVT
jgi:hypothetical protein